MSLREWLWFCAAVIAAFSTALALAGTGILLLIN